ncbi:phosphonate metabolism protein/1,5-bisphosphokinase (PRPP-forming) PhnN [Xanthobacteraceae bacterium Astr-EGSB]|uniref:phosphonate metabolism protein/1,5-bisphosphokinase (PRPP-forming) PhnN n=1 Tax=Astrobacterium formosum TaxID=3069710 RepID=UPI0027B04981|nr:phosphonate metabolism protein/1,5-bisphosphokinase (PRPP-forming) PhnN [Xanthobacteraceae bacterium Astr-EGSB]
MSGGDDSSSGTLVLVVGPSGAGKDTLIAIARDLVGTNERVSFPRRIVTRESSAAEIHDTMAADEFDDAVRHGAFAFWWPAHGLKYGLPSAIDDDLRRGVTVVCNVSRAVVGRLRQTYADCKVVLVDAPRDVRAARLAARGRRADGDARARLDRLGEAFVPDLVIMNVGDPGEGGRALADAILAEAS